MRTALLGIVALNAALLVAACQRTPPPAAEGADADGHVAPSAQTAAKNHAVLDELPFHDRTDFEEAQRGLVAADPDMTVSRADNGKVLWRASDYAFIQGPAPDSVNPSLWRQAQLNEQRGLFKVTEGVYQLRGFDLANMDLIEGKSGWIVVDPLTTTETAAHAVAFARAKLGDQPIRAVIFTHSHVDHFGGVGGILDANVASGVRIIAPKGFTEEATSENVMAGIGMGRRAVYMYGQPLARGPRGHVDTGLGVAPAMGGHIGIRRPTELVDHSGQELDIDGVHFVFQYVPDSEAPAELTFYLPDRKAFCGAELVSRTLHNLYTLRGAKVRDALRWSDYIDDALLRFGEAEVYFSGHMWPVWGRDRIRLFMKSQRDLLKYIHDQTLRLANAGATPDEIAEQLRLPASLRSYFWNRDYYGTVRHNAKAVYQRYFGWYDGNPADLDPLPPEQAGKKYVDAMGGADAVIAKAQAAYAAGEYRWAAELLNHLVFAEPANAAAKSLLAKAYDQLGYQAESGPWRDEYLTAAQELRHGVKGGGLDPADALDLLRQTPIEAFFDSMAATLDGPAADGKNFTINFVFTDLGETHVLWIENSVLHHRKQPAVSGANATVKLTREFFLGLVTRKAGLKDMLFSGELKVDGSRLDLLRFFSLFKRPEGNFNVVTP